ncbi:MAG: hypothetical protein EB127_08635 [Alphaproteobacteria bacterium]|nr:hypothetical protein [Alphaproteobacteria bacterium]
MKTSVPQILEEVEKQKNREAKIRVLRSYDSVVLKGILRLNYDPSMVMDLPPGEPPFRKNIDIPEGYSESNLYVEFRRFYIWLDPTKNINKIRKESLFIQMLEGMHWRESELVCLAKDRKIDSKYKSISYDLVYDAFPGLLPTKIVEEKKLKKVKVPLKE